MEYWILTESENIVNLIWREQLDKLTGVGKILLRVEDAISWLIEEKNRKLLITMPLDKVWRQEIAQQLGHLNEQCIGLDPIQLLSGSSPIFTETRIIQVSLFSQIREIIESEKRLA